MAAPCVAIAANAHVAAARKELGTDARVPLIVVPLNDADMLRYMGRENLEDYSAQFLVMLEAWEAATKFIGRPDGQDPQDIEIATILGWPPRRSGQRENENTITDAAQASAAASKLIKGPMHNGPLVRWVTAANRMCERLPIAGDNGIFGIS